MTLAVQPITQQSWQTFTGQHPESNFLYSWQWGELHEHLGFTIVRRGLYQDSTLVGVLFGIIKDARRGRYLEVPAGPLIDWHDEAVVTLAVATLGELAKQAGCVFVRIRPQVHDSLEINTILESHGLKPAPMHLHAEHTNILDLGMGEPELLAGMRRQTRYEVRQADKKGVVVSYRNSPVAVREFFEVQAETAQRQHFIPPSLTVLQAQAKIFGDHLRIYRAEKDGQLLALGLIIFYGPEVDYFEAASKPEGRQYPGAYAIQWRAIRDAKALGYKRYNFWGIAYTNNPHHRYAGVTTFKRGFGGHDVVYVHAHDLIIHKVKYLKNWTIEHVRKKVRKL